MHVHTEKSTKGLPPYMLGDEKALISYPESKILPVCVASITVIKRPTIVTLK
jgi:hypothetical protein